MADTDFMIPSEISRTLLRWVTTCGYCGRDSRKDRRHRLRCISYYRVRPTGYHRWFRMLRAWWHRG